MKNAIRLAAGIVAAGALALALSGCATTEGLGSGTIMKSAASTKAVARQTSAVVTVSGPYDAAKACIAQIPEIHTLNISVGTIRDDTGKTNVTDGGTGSFIGNGATNMFNATFAALGVKLDELSPEYRGTIDWLNAKGVKGGLISPQLIVMGSVSALDFLPGASSELSVFGFGPKTRAYTALGRMDVRLVTLPYGKTAGGAVIASSSVAKQFAAVETQVGFGSFVGNGLGLTYASFNISSGQREPMQYTLSYMVDYAAVDLLGNLLDDLSAKGQIKDRRAAVAACRALFELPSHTANTQVASTK